MPQTPNYKWKTGDEIGAGSFGKVFKGVEKKSKKNVAIKTFTVKLKEYIKREADLLSLVDHPNIVKFITFEKTKKLGYILVMELCNGCLCEVIYPTGLDYSEFIRLCNGLCNAIQHLWQKDIVHRDIKPENILMVKSSAGQNIYKLGDFGAARILPPDETYKSLYGTYEFLHPDIFAKYHQAGLKEVRRNEHFIATHELWSVGVTLYTAATGQLPFRPEKEREDYQTMFNMITQKQPRHIAAAETKDGQITWSSKLPAHALGISRKRHIETYLAGLLTSNKENVWSYDRYFEETNNLGKVDLETSHKPQPKKNIKKHQNKQQKRRAKAVPKKRRGRHHAGKINWWDPAKSQRNLRRRL